MTFPWRRDAEEHLGVPGQRRLGQTPPLQLPPIDHTRIDSDLRRRQRFPGPTLHDRLQHARRFGALGAEIENGAADNPVIYPVARDAIYRRSRDRRNAANQVARAENVAALIATKRGEDDDTTPW